MMLRSLAAKAGMLLATAIAVLWIGWERPADSRHGAAPPTTGPRTSAPVDPGAPAPRLDVNRATLAELAALPGIGDVLAGRIVMHREDNGLYEAIENLLEVNGIGAKRLERLRPLIRATAQPPTASSAAQPARPLEEGRTRS